MEKVMAQIERALERIAREGTRAPVTLPGLRSAPSEGGVSHV